MTKIIGQGAEATITLIGESVIKNRIKKEYRIPEIDESLRKSRTKREAKILTKLVGIAPKLIKTDNESIIEMEYIKGELVKNFLDQQPEISKEIGKNAAIMHDLNLVHGDLTTSNMILDKQNNLRFIDFGLSFTSHKIEDKAVDLHLFLEAVESKHYLKKDKIWENFLKGYNPDNKEEILKRLELVKKRGRNKDKY